MIQQFDVRDKLSVVRLTGIFKQDHPEIKIKKKKTTTDDILLTGQIFIGLVCQCH